MFEHRHEPLLPRRLFLRRLAQHGAIALGLIGVALGIGILGYHWCEGLDWLDSLLNAAMILSGMGPANQLQHVAGKWFASFYALFSGIVFISIAGVLIAPVAHRFLHRFHLNADSQRD